MAKNAPKPAKKDAKPKHTIRERNRKAAEAKDKPKRIRKAATQVKQPVSKLGTILTAEYHLFPQKNPDGFFTKSRNATPRYFVDSIAELNNVTWPGRKETWKLVFAVFTFAISLGVFIAVLDYGLERLFRNIIL